MELSRVVVELTEAVVRLFNDKAYAEFIAVGAYLRYGHLSCPGHVDSHVLSILTKASQLPDDVRLAVWDASVAQINEAMDTNHVMAYKRVIMQHVLDRMENVVVGVDNVADTFVGVILALVERAYCNTTLFTLSPSAILHSPDLLVLCAKWIMLLNGVIDDSADASRFLNEATKRFGRRL